MHAFVLAGGQAREVDGSAVAADDPGLLRGESVFETLSVGRSGPVLLAEHLARLARSAAALGLALPDVTPLTRVGRPGESLRLVVTRGGTAMALTDPLPDHSRARADGVSVVSLCLGLPAALRPQAPWLLGGAKTTSYAVAMAGQREAQARGADDAVWTSVEGEVLEATTANLVWVTEGVLTTVDPALTGILDGTTLRWALTQVDRPVSLRRAPLAEVLAADEVLLTSSVRGVVGVRQLDSVRLGPPGPVTRHLQQAWQQLLDA